MKILFKLDASVKDLIWVFARLHQLQTDPIRL